LSCSTIEFKQPSMSLHTLLQLPIECLGSQQPAARLSWAASDLRCSLGKWQQATCGNLASTAGINSTSAEAPRAVQDGAYQASMSHHHPSIDRSA